MKANRPLSLMRLPRRHRWLLAGLGVAQMVLLASCAPPPAMAPTPPLVVPTSAPAAPPPPPPRAAAVDWHDAPITPGNWVWSREGDASVARYGDHVLVMRCVMSARTVQLMVGTSAAIPASTPMSMSVTTSTQSRPLEGVAG